mmetsp:Transcript_105288/g.304559  ORF Transcript_105288/g.304559 Transcript_105288/m.304559 type:complete len:200 (-) Transcript_105288:163-762(-)
MEEPLLPMHQSWNVNSLSFTTLFSGFTVQSNACVSQPIAAIDCSNAEFVAIPIPYTTQRPFFPKANLPTIFFFPPPAPLAASWSRIGGASGMDCNTVEYFTPLTFGSGGSAPASAYFANFSRCVKANCSKASATAFPTTPAGAAGLFDAAGVVGVDGINGAINAVGVAALAPLKLTLHPLPTAGTPVFATRSLGASRIA